MTLKTIIKDIIFKIFVDLIESNINAWVFDGYEFPLAWIFINLFQKEFETLDQFSLILCKYLLIEEDEFMQVVNFVGKDTVGLELKDVTYELTQVYYYFFPQTVVVR